MLTLHAYILRELLKTFALAILALAALFTMGGGLYNVIKYGGITPRDVAQIFPLLLPVVITLTMPVAALFAATMVYGRLASDSEFVACRAAGINVHRLFAPAMLLAIFVSLFTIFFANFVIPDFMRQIEHFARSNVRDWAFQKLRQHAYIYHVRGNERYLLTPRDIRPVSRAELARKGFDLEHSYFWIDAPNGVWIDESGLRSVVSASGALCQFDTSGDGVEVTIYLNNARTMELGQRTVQARNQTIGPFEAPLRLPLKASMVDLATLLRWRDDPVQIPEVSEALEGLLLKLTREQVYAFIASRLAADEPLVLESATRPGRRVRIRADAVDLGSERPVLTGARVQIEQGDRQLLRYEAPVAEILLVDDDHRARVDLRLAPAEDVPVLEFDSVRPDLAPERGDTLLPDWEVPGPVAAALADVTPRSLLAGPPAGASAQLAEDVAAEERETARLQRRVKGLIHFRLAYAGSALVTIVMGAALGTIFLGARALSAFGLACIPLAIVTVTALTGRQLTEKVPTEALGPFVIWGGLVAVGIADAIILRLGVRR